MPPITQPIDPGFNRQPPTQQKTCPTCGQVIGGGKPQLPPGQPRPPMPPGYKPQPLLPEKPLPGKLKPLPTVPNPTPPGSPSKPRPLPGQLRKEWMTPEFIEQKRIEEEEIMRKWREDPEAAMREQLEERRKKEQFKPKRPGISKPTYPLPYPKKYRR